MKLIPCETFSRVTGYIRPISAWNPGKQQEHIDRHFIKMDKESLRK